MKVAPTDLSLNMGTVQVSDAPLQAPVHPTKACFRAGLAVSVTLVPTVKDFEHVVPQLIPFGLLVTLPEPVRVTLSVYCWVGGTNVADTDRAAVIVVSQVPVPLQSPLHPVKMLPFVGVAASDTAVLASSRIEQVAPQSMPLPATVPVPPPALVTDNCHCWVNVADTVALALRVKLQPVVPVHGPLQPLKMLPALGVALSDTNVPASRCTEQVLPQVMLLPATVPAPLPNFCTTRSTCGAPRPAMW